MVLGTTSGAGKSWLTTALCRWYARAGLKVAPFKAQNMSNNARVVAGLRGGYGEIGSAQYFQALAANAVPDVRMNPVLLKPEADTRSQVVLLGEVSAELTGMPWRGRSEHVWPSIAQSLDALRAENDVVVIEGAGSPAEINLHASDIVNMRVARYAGARCLLVTDIDRGGAFAHLYGTWALLPANEQALIAGFVLNKFRGDASLLAPAPEMLKERTGIATLATLPMLYRHGLPEEDGVFDDRSISTGTLHTKIAVIAYPRISNLDEFQALKNVDGVKLVWARSPADLEGTDWIILPGSKHTLADLAWLRSQGLDVAVVQHAEQGKRVLGICGGLQMLGQFLLDPLGMEGGAAKYSQSEQGLNLLALTTELAAVKTVQPCQGRFGCLAGAWAALSNVSFAGYEIHVGQTQETTTSITSISALRDGTGSAIGWCNQQGQVLGLYAHGLFESEAVLAALFGSQARSLDAVFEHLADFVEQHFEPSVLRDLIG
jgi:adenosylcobyric acid synthase